MKTMLYSGTLVPTLGPHFNFGLHLHMKHPTDEDSDRVAFYTLACGQSTVYQVNWQGDLYQLTGRKLVSLIALHWECEDYLRGMAQGTYLMLAGVEGAMDSLGLLIEERPGPKQNGRMAANVITIDGSLQGFFRSSQPIGPESQIAVSTVYERYVWPWFDRMQLLPADA